MMNDFTKEELECMLEWSQELGLEYGTQGDEMDIKLTNKIQSMIDNYCEHDGEIGKDYPAEKCMKCGAYWE